MTQEKRRVLRDAWRITKPYFVSEEKWKAWGLLAAVIALNLASVYISVRINEWRNDFYNALQNFNEQEFFHQLLIFSVLAGIDIIMLVYQVYIGQMLQIRWRRWLTDRYLNAWLADRAYYRIQLASGGTDNPDQRISEDLDRFTRQTLALSVGPAGVLNALVTLGSFMVILWTLSGVLTLPFGPWGSMAIPGYMVWAALIYAVGGTWITIKIGRPLVGLNFNQQRYEADFRFSLVRLRENAESVAFYGGEKREHDGFTGRFERVLGNFWGIMRRTKLVNWFTYGYGQAAIIFPYLVAAPRYFSHEFELGGLMQTASAFGEVQTALSFIVNAYTDIAEWQSVVQRLSGFEDRLREIGAAASAPQSIELRHDGHGLDVAALDLDLPNGAPLLRDVAVTVPTGASLLVAAPTGTGKSTLLRAIAGLWPFGRGRIRVGEGRAMFLPQRPYLPLGSLRQALLYPAEREDIPNEKLASVLTEVGLGRFAGELDTADNWAQRLSLGEQQRLAFGRILLSEPAIVFLDEATSALDEESEAALYALLRRAPWRPTVVSVGHRSTLRDFHDRVLSLAGNGRQSDPAPAVAGW
jgi:vitamin B12/bleomycin/antimicrobial peptide transport system ATP-binding/permease protein